MNLKNVKYVHKDIDLHQMVIVVYHKFKIVKHMVLQIQIVFHIHVQNVKLVIIIMKKIVYVLKVRYHFVRNMNMMKMNVLDVKKIFI